MKANYLLKNRSKNSYLKKVFLLIIIFVAGAGIINIFGESIISVAVPLWKTENAVSKSFYNSLGFFRSKHALIEENSQLKERLASLEITLASQSIERSQQSLLTDLLGRRPRADAVLAGVLIHPPQTPYDVIIVDAGSNESLGLGSEVSMPDGPILGYVSEVFDKRSKVKLFSSSGEKTNALLERHSVPVVLEGVGSGNFKIVLPRDIAIEVGDRIISADVTGRLLAVVEEVGSEPTDSFKDVLARSPANIFSIRFVFITP